MRNGLLFGILLIPIVGSSAGPSSPVEGAPGGATGAIVEGFTVDGVIRPSEQVPLGIPVEGRLGEVVVERGEKVTAGQYLASLECEVEEYDLALARSRVTQTAEIESARVRISHARESLEAQQALEGLVSEQELRVLRTDRRLAEIELIHAEERRQVAELEVARAEARLAQRRISSPFDGIVTEKHLSPGQLVDSGHPVLTVVKIDPLHVETYVPVEWLGRVAMGDTAVVHSEAPGSTPLAATIELVDPVVDAASHTFGVRLTVPNPDGTITAGVRCRVEFLGGAR